MKTSAGIWLLLSMTATLIACNQPGRPRLGVTDDVRTSIEAANQATAESVARGDASGIISHYADDAMMLPAGADPVAGPGAIKGYFQRAMDAGMKGFKLEIVSLDADGDLAVETGTYLASDARGNHIDHGKYVVAWRRVGGAWKVYRDISTTSMPVLVGTPEGRPLPAHCSGTDAPAIAPAMAPASSG